MELPKVPTLIVAFVIWSIKHSKQTKKKKFIHRNWWSSFNLQQEVIFGSRICEKVFKAAPCGCNSKTRRCFATPQKEDIILNREECCFPYPERKHYFRHQNCVDILFWNGRSLRFIKSLILS